MTKKLPLPVIVAGALGLAAVALWVGRPRTEAAAPPPLALDCAACLQRQCTKPMYQLDCARLTGSRAQLCATALACVRQHDCAGADGDLRACFCGKDVDVPECIQKGARGPCKAALEAAAESTDPRQVAERWNDPNFPIGQALHVAGCELGPCRAACGH